MSNLTPEDVNLRLTETRNELQLEDTRLWQGLEDERVSRIAGDAANNNLIENTNTALAAQEARLSVEVVQREEGDLRNITSLSELAQALADYRIKTDLELNIERIARQQLGVDLNTRVDDFVATFDHKFLMVYQTIQTYQTSTTASINALDLRVKAYEDMLQDITTDSIQITMDNGEINMGAWTILSQARQWDLEILAKFKDYKTQTSLDIDDALQDIQNQLPVEQTIINSALNALSNSQIIQNLDAAINSNAAGINTLVDDLLQEVSDRQSDMLTLSQNINDQLVSNQTDLVRMVEAEAAARINELQREANIRQQELVNEANERSAEIDEKLHDALGNLNVDLSGVYSEINQVSAALDAEEAARIAAITDLNNGLTHEIQLRQDGDTANLTAINNYKTANDTALANVRSDLQANVTATTANASNITALDARLVANESLAASAVNKAETALTQNSAMASEITSVKASITDIENSLADKADASALQLLDSKVTVIDGKVTTNASDITQLKTNVTTLTNTKADSTALNALTSTVATQGNTITSQGKNISDLTAAISTSVPEIKFTGTQDCINITAAFASNPDVTLVTEPSAVSGKVVRIGNNSGNDQFNGIMNSYVAIDPNKLYRVKYRIRRVLNDAAGMYLSLVQTNATKTFNVMSSNTTIPLTDISDSLYYLINAKPALDTWFTGEYYFKGKSAGASSGAGTLASPRTFSADAAFFRIGILSNYPVASGTQDVDYIIVEDYDAMALGNANAAATTALTARVTSAEGTLTSNSTAITQLQNSLTTTNNTVATKADASAVNALDSKVTTIGSNVTSNSNAITQLQNDLTTTNATVNTKASAAGLTALDTKVTSIDGKVTTQGTQITTLNSSLAVTDKLARLTSQGKPLRDDPNFKTSANLIVYGDQEGYTFTRQTITADNPSGSTHEYHMAMTQAITGIGIGFYPNPVGISTAANKVFLFKMVLKAPVGAVINIHKNVTGTASTYEMLGNNLGTGKFETYYFWLQCGPTGTFSTAGHVTITQGTATIGTPSVPFEVTVASYEVWDVTTVDDSIPKIWADKVDANATAVTSLNSQVTSINGTVTSQGSQLTTLTNRVSTVEGSVANKADSSVVSSLDSKVTTIDGKVTQNANAITTLTGRVTTVENGLTNKADTSVLVNYSTKTETNTAIATGIQNYNASLIIGSVNVLLNSEAARTSVAASNKEYLLYERSTDLKAFYDENLGKPVTISFEMSVPVAGSVQVYTSNDSAHSFSIPVVATEVDKFVKYAVTVTPAVHPSTPAATQSTLEFYGIYGTGCIPTIRKAQVEAGTKATAWSPSPRDTQAALDTNASAITITQANVTALDGLISSNSNEITTLKSRVITVEGVVNTNQANLINNYYTKAESDDKATTIAAGKISAYDANLVIGGVNLIPNSFDIPQWANNSAIWPLDVDVINGVRRIRRIGGTEPAIMSNYTGVFIDLPVGTVYTISVKVRPIGSDYLLGFYGNDTSIKLCKADQWTTIQATRTITNQPERVAALISYAVQQGVWIEVKEWQAEIGNKATSWSPSPADVHEAINANANAIQTVNAEVSRINGEVVSTANNVNTLTSSVGLLQGSINEVRQTVTNNQESTNTLVTSLRSGMADADDVSMMMRSAAIVLEDITFKNGFNGVEVYNNYYNGVLAYNFTSKQPDNPVVATRQLQFIHSGGQTDPKLGGFSQATQSRANGVFLVKFVAKLPVGYSFGLYSNAFGEGASAYFIGSSEGTGKYKTYYGVYRCGATGTFTTLGFVAVNGPHPTPENPLIWYLASSTVYDCLDSKVAPDSVVNGIAEAKTIASTAVNKSDAAAILAQNLQTSLDSTNANIATNYYTKSSTDQAIASASNQLSSSFNTAINNVGVITDTRYDNQPPSWYWANYPRRTIKEFKNSYNIGIPQATVDALGVLETVIPWNDLSGGPIQQRFTWNDSAYALTRYSISNSSWSAWASALNEVKTAVDRKLDASVISNYYTKAEADNVVAGKVEQFSSSMAVGGANLWSVVGATHISELGSHSVAVIREDEEELYIAINSLTSGVSLIRFDSCLIDQNTQFIAGEDVVLSFEVSGSGYYRLGTVYAYVGNVGSAIFTPNVVTDPSVWQRVEYKFKASGVQVNGPNQLLGFRLDSADGWNTGAALKLRHVQLQRGKTATAFSKAPAITRAAVKETTQTVNGIQAIKTVSIDNNGFISGYGLISQLVNGVVQSAFGVNADYFYVGTSTSNQKKPFMVLTSSQTIDGVTYPAGTWMDVALIANATIGTAHIADASITNAKIATLDASKITTGVLNANRIRVGPTSTFDEGYNPTTKARTFIAQPTVPYSEGDIWKDGSSTYICKTARVAGSFTASEWDKVGDVTSENTAADSAKLGGTAASVINQNITNADAKAVAADSKAAVADNKATIAQATANTANNQVDAWKFTGTTEIDGGKIRADTVTAAQINVNELSAISANLGTLVTYKDPAQPLKARMVMQGSLITVYDDNNTVRVRLGLW